MLSIYCGTTECRRHEVGRMPTLHYPPLDWTSPQTWGTLPCEFSLCSADLSPCLVCRSIGDLPSSPRPELGSTREVIGDKLSGLHHIQLQRPRPLEPRLAVEVRPNRHRLGPKDHRHGDHSSPRGDGESLSAYSGRLCRLSRPRWQTAPPRDSKSHPHLASWTSQRRRCRPPRSTTSQINPHLPPSFCKRKREATCRSSRAGHRAKTKPLLPSNSERQRHHRSIPIRPSARRLKKETPRRWRFRKP